MATQWDNLEALAAQVAGAAGLQIDAGELATIMDEAMPKVRE